MTVPFAVLLSAEMRSRVLPDVADNLTGTATEVGCDDPTARVLITGWGSPMLTRELLDRHPDLALVAHAAGSVRSLLGPGFWDRGIQVTAAAAANADPVAEFCVAQVVLALKSYWHLALLRGRPPQIPGPCDPPGIRGATVGLVGLGLIGSRVAQRLTAMGVEVIAYDPHASSGRAAARGVRLVDLATLFEHGEVVSLHAPLYAATVGLIREEHLSLMRPGATLVNTARARLIDGDALVRVLTRRVDLLALLDVTDPEPLPANHPLLGLDNVMISPHLAGSLGRETRAMGQLVVDEIKRFVAGEPLEHVITRSAFEVSA